MVYTEENRDNAKRRREDSPIYRGWPNDALDSRVIERQNSRLIVAPDSQHYTYRRAARASRHDLGGE